mmetsp:Transcript_21237/g.43613  ORF Transcript_21237/g.43613 Transcript_21237/m.43613 type:complete len:724 (+) Transcript_21237:279-2450(+)
MIPRGLITSWCILAATTHPQHGPSSASPSLYAHAFLTPHLKHALPSIKSSTPSSSFANTFQTNHVKDQNGLLATVPKDNTSTSPPSPLSFPLTTTTTTTQSSANADPQSNTKLRKLKDCMWVREALEDLTAAEFASSLSVEDDESENPIDSQSPSAGSPTSNNTKSKSKRKRAVDFENVLNKLDARIEEMCILTTRDAARESNQTCYVLDRRVVGEGGNATTIENLCYSLAENQGMGGVVYTQDQREALLQRLLATRERLSDMIQGNLSGGRDISDSSEIMEDIRSTMQPEDYISVATQDKKDAAVSSFSSGSAPAASFDPSLYVREDGTIDWDGALQDREALKKFGSAVWSRINGQDPEVSSNGGEDSEGGLISSEDESHTPAKAVTAKIVETEAIREKRNRLDVLKAELNTMEIEHTKLLNSAISAGQAVANVNFATINPALRMKIRVSSDELEKKKAEVTYQTLNYELERIYTYLEGELGNTATKGYIPLQDRLNVAEFGLLESQIDSFNRQMELGETLDADVLAVVADQLTDFKRRLGIDYYVTGLTLDSEAIQIWLKDIWIKTKKGLVFYVKGTRLFIDDIVFCLNLIGKALQGYTLKPREVRTLRRTFKDMITFIPVVIILLIPLSPIGHVLVFGAIQRVFPDFFPSCFTERRQNLLELYESTEYSAVVINETWQEKLVRLLQAIGFFAGQLGSRMYTSLGGVLEKSGDDVDDAGKQ